MSIIAKNKVFASLLLVGTCVVVAVISDGIADYYDDEVPRWVYYAAMIPSAAALVFAFVNFQKAFPKNKKED